MIDFLKQDIAIHKRQLEAYRRQTRRLWIMAVGLMALLLGFTVFGINTIRSINTANRQIIENAISLRKMESALMQGENHKPRAANPQRPPKGVFNALKIAQNAPSKP